MARSRTLRVLKAVLLAALGLVAGVLLALELLLALAPVREQVRRRVVPLVNDALPAQLEVGRLQQLSITGYARAADVKLKDRRGRLVASAAEVGARIDLFALIGGEVRLSAVKLVRPWADLGGPLDDDGRRGGLLHAFDEPGPEPPPEPESADELGVSLRDIRIEQGRVEAWLGRERWSMAAIDARGAFAIADELEVNVAQLSGDLARARQRVTHVRNARGRYRPLGSSQAELELEQGATRVTARAELGAPARSGEQSVRGRARVRAFTADTLAPLGVRVTELAAPFDLELRAQGSTRKLHAQAQLHTPGGRLQLDGFYAEGEQLSATASSDGLVPRRFLRSAIAPLAGRVRLRAEPRPALPAAELWLELERGRYAGVTLPHTTAHGSFQPEQGLLLERVVARYDHATVTASGRIDGAGAIAVSAQVQSDALQKLPPVQAFAPALSGKLEAALELRKAEGELSLLGSVKLARAAYSDARLRLLELELKLTGASLEQAHVELVAGAAGLHASGLSLPEAGLRLAGGPELYQLRASFGRYGDQLQARIHRSGERIRADGGGRITLRNRGVLEASVGQLAWQPGGALELADVYVEHLGARVFAHGRIDPGGRSKLSLRVQADQLERVTRAWLRHAVPGELELRAELEGSLQMPHVQIDGRYGKGNLYGLRDLRAQLSALVDAPKRTVELDALVHSGSRSLAVTLRSELATAALTPAAFRRGRHELVVESHNIALHELDPWPKGGAVPAVALVSGEIRANGELDRFDATCDLRSTLRFNGDRTPLGVALRGHYSDRELALDLEADDPKGPLLRSSMRTELERRPFLSVPDDPIELLQKRAWQASLWLGSRRIDELPAARVLQIHRALLPAQVSAKAELAHAPGQEPEGELRMQALWKAPGKHSAAASCGLSQPLRVGLDARMAKGELHSELQGSIGRQPALALTTASRAPFDEWLQPQPGQVRPVSVALKLSQLRFADVPVVCEYANGTLSGAAQVERALAEAVTAKVDLRAADVRLGKAPAFDATLSASADRKAFLVWVDIAGEHGKTSVRGRVPMDGGGRLPTPDLDAAAFLRADLHRLDVRSALAAVPGVRATSGELDGQVVLAGPLRAPSLGGGLALNDVSLTFAELGQRFEHVDGKLRLDGKKLYVEKLQVRDRGGRADVTGEVTLYSLEAFKLDLKAKADDLPVRRSGVMLAHLDGKVGLLADIKPERTELWLSMRDGRVQLTGESLVGVQPLEPNPEIVFVDEAGRRAREEAEQARAENPPTLTILHFDAKEPFWIRRSDFSALVRPRLRVELFDGRTSVAGTVEIERGVAELLGQQFDIERGRIEFTGGHDVKPQLALVARRRVPGGADVQLKAEGPLAEPNLTFTVDGKEVTAGEALAAATGTRVGAGGDASARQQIGSVATGIAAGVLTLGARREFGDWLPVLAVERAQGATRLRAGVEAGRFIPGFLRKLVVDAYVEGSVSTAPEAADAQIAPAEGPQTAVLLELRFPKDLVGEAQYGPGQRWSVDLSWEP